mmetsp:Transcript_11032/g.24289  ORF Transcript_11032/g.24289 Transcript_11032/m.24289 type:complete len:247 (+) Transcript_11032:69-809(+)
MEKQVTAAVIIQRYFRGHLARLRQRLCHEFVRYRHERLAEWKERGGPGTKPVVRLASSIRILQEEFRKVQENIPQSICTIQLEDSDLFRWLLEVPGPPASPYQGGRFRFLVVFPPEHPHGDFPSMRCMTPIFHCNIDENGTVCADGLQSFEACDLAEDSVDGKDDHKEDGTDKALDLVQEAEESSTSSKAHGRAVPRSQRIIEAVCSLLCCPLPENALNSRAAELLRTRPRDYHRRARDFTLLHAC